MNQEQNNLNPNNLNTQGNNEMPNNQNLNNTFNSSMQQSTNINQPTYNPQSQSTLNYQQSINQMNTQQPTPQSMNSFESEIANNDKLNNKRPKKTNLGLIIGAVAIILIVVGVSAGIVIFNNLKDRNDGDISNSNIDNSDVQVPIEGKNPYNTNVNECAFDFIEYKDNTRDLCKQSWIDFTPANSSSTHYVDYSSFSFYLDKEETTVLSYSWDGKDKNAGYKFIGTLFDEETNNYVYVFTDLVNDGKYYLFLPEVEKFDIFDFTNESKTDLSANDVIYTGSFEQQFAYQKSYSINKVIKKVGSLDVAVAYFGKSSKDDVKNNIDLFFKYISLDSGAPFIFDYMLTNNPLGYNSENEDTAYYIKSYKYINGISYLASTGSIVNANTGLNYKLLIDGIEYNYSSYYVLVTDDEKYNPYRTETYLKGAKYALWSAFIREDNVFAITLNIWNNSKIYNRYGFVVKTPDYSLGISYYIDNFTKVLITQTGKNVGTTELYKKNK